ncbi:M56 family metallopeptidase [Eubacteriales bacterium OttesenSCG-928-A19]|nr:M56 family metallopeptidase [Eubacteriales bacterium OttesenSCG-928-A19]
MNLHFSAVFTVSLLTGIAIILYRFYFLNLQSISRIGVSVFLFNLMALLLRLLFPMEFAFTVTIPVEHGMPTLTRFLAIPVAKWGGTDITILSVLTAVWAVVSSALFVQMIVSYQRYRKGLVALSRTLDVHELTEGKLNEDEATALSKVLVVQSCHVQSPLILGQIKPIIVLPMLQLTPDEWVYVIRHEINHYRYGDLWIKLFVKITLIVYWWNPVIHILARLITELLEIRNDKRIIASMPAEEKIAYYECLLKIAKSRTRKRRDRLALAFDSAKKNVAMRRIRLIDSEEKKFSRTKHRVINVTIALVAVITVLSFFVVFESSSMPGTHAAGNYELSQDNSYIILSGEQYDIYLDDAYMATVSVIPDSLFGGSALT